VFIEEETVDRLKGSAGVVEQDTISDALQAPTVGALGEVCTPAAHSCSLYFMRAP
jgi:hypothetical protein